MTWLPITYRDFYDVPRLFVVQHAGVSYLFDSPFDEKADRYAGQYTVYRLDRDAVVPADTEPWEAVGRGGERLGEVEVSAVRLDATQRAAIDATVLAMLSRSTDPRSHGA